MGFRFVSIALTAFAVLVSGCSTSPTAEPPEPAATPQTIAAAPEATDIPFDECADLTDAAPAVNQERIDALQDRLTAEGVGRQPNFGGFVGRPYVSGRLNVLLTHRNQQTIDWLGDRVIRSEVCLSLPPEGYYDPPWEVAALELWKVTERAPQREFILLVTRPRQGCGGDPRGQMLDPIITYGIDTVEVTLPLKPLPWGAMFTCPGYKRPRFNLTLDEDLGDRDLVLIQPAAG